MKVIRNEKRKKLVVNYEASLFGTNGWGLLFFQLFRIIEVGARLVVAGCMLTEVLHLFISHRPINSYISVGKQDLVSFYKILFGKATLTKDNPTTHKHSNKKWITPMFLSTLLHQWKEKFYVTVQCSPRPFPRFTQKQ